MRGGIHAEGGCAADGNGLTHDWSSVSHDACAAAPKQLRKSISMAVEHAAAKAARHISSRPPPPPLGAAPPAWPPGPGSLRHTAAPLSGPAPPPPAGRTRRPAGGEEVAGQGRAAGFIGRASGGGGRQWAAAAALARVSPHLLGRGLDLLRIWRPRLLPGAAVHGCGCERRSVPSPLRLPRPLIALQSVCTDHAAASIASERPPAASWLLGACCGRHFGAAPPARCDRPVRRGHRDHPALHCNPKPPACPASKQD